MATEKTKAQLRKLYMDECKKAAGMALRAKETEYRIKELEKRDVVRCDTIVKQGEQIQAMQLQQNKLCADLRDLEWDRDSLCQVVGELSLKLKRDRSMRFDGERR